MKDNFIEPLTCSKTASAIGPYSKATRVNLGNVFMIFVSGQLGVNAQTGEFDSQDVAFQAKQSLENLKNVLEENNSSLDMVSKTTVFLADMDDFKVFNEVYAQYFVNNLPARSTVAVKTLPKNAKIEIECVAFSKN